MNPQTSNLNPKILCVVGPTSSGKSELAVRLAKKFNGEVISCDSRQIYRGMDLGTGKVEGKWTAQKTRKSKRTTQSHVFLYKTIPHHLLDVASPTSQYSAARFQKAAQTKIREILKRGKLPILCGGTGHWMDAVVFDQQLPEVKPDKKLRAKLERQTSDSLFAELQRLDPARAGIIDRHNKRRLVRALEIVMTTGKPVPSLSPLPSAPSPYRALWLGISVPQEILYPRIEKRLKARLEAGMLKEITKLKRKGLSWKRLEDFGLEYRFGAQYLQKKISQDEMLEQMLLANKHYAKRQMTWWKRNGDIRWITNSSDADKMAAGFIKGNKNA